MTNHFGKAFEDRYQEWALDLAAEREVVVVVFEIPNTIRYRRDWELLGCDVMDDE
jgi:hypothetical protein